ncbi:dehydrogenase [Microbacterium sp. Root166]|uniref:Gfo/Idh/MocA family protein n=1 Tax=Microbacterium sp. Root166 TaxID=1736478 RepID=UPI0006FFA3BD|nr:Gfo/Idh/MocA family oxidoreductase [Microbacterium sp. Root166]KQZ85837.1 dehydrogenase [Microbacterium sp. Root166]
MHNVGVIGAGPGVRALHVPTLGSLTDDYRIVHVADAGGGRAEGVARTVDARWSGSADALLADPAVDIVAICTPPATHAALILAAVAAGKRAIFCEKPLAVSTEELDAVLRVCAANDVVLVVGTNHLFDPAWDRVKQHLDRTRARVLSVSSTVALAPNDRYHALVADTVPAAVPEPRPPIDLSDPIMSAAIVRQLLTGLAIHDLPLVRDLLPEFESVEFGRAVAPIGYDVGIRAGGALARLSAVMLPAGADSRWRFTIVTTHDRVEIDFPPPFVHVGSARVRVRDEAGRVTRFPVVDEDGYQAEWRSLAEILRGERPMEYDELEADARFAIALADAAADVVRRGAAA